MKDDEIEDPTMSILGKRKRNEVNYKETSDTQFFKQNQMLMDSQEAAQQEKRKKRRAVQGED